MLSNRKHKGVAGLFVYNNIFNLPHKECKGWGTGYSIIAMLGNIVCIASLLTDSLTPTVREPIFEFLDILSLNINSLFYGQSAGSGWAWQSQYPNNSFSVKVVYMLYIYLPGWKIT